MSKLARRRGKALAAVVLGLGLLAGGAQVVRHARASRGVGDVPTVRLAPARFLNAVTAEGYVQAKTSTPVTAPSTQVAMTVAWLADDGAPVKAGDVVIRLEATDIEKQIADAHDDRSAADLRIAKEQLESDSRMRERERQQRLTSTEIEQRRGFPALDERFFPKTEIVEAELDETLGHARIAYAESVRTAEKALTHTRLDILGIQKRKANFAAKVAGEALGQLEAKAPHEGILVYVRNWRGQMPKVGDSVWPGNPIAEVAALGEMQARAFVLEADAGGLAPGKRAMVTLDSAPDLPMPAVVDAVDALAQPYVPGVPMGYFGVTLRFDMAPGRALPDLRPGQRLAARIELEDLPAALVVPRQAVFDHAGKPSLWKRRGDRFEAAAVKLGVGTVGRVVITEGAAAGDDIALRDPTRALDAPPPVAGAATGAAAP